MGDRLLDFVIDHGVALAAILLGVLVTTGVLVAVIRGLRLYRVARRAQALAATEVATLSAEVARAQEGVERLAVAQEELARELDALNVRLAVARVLARHVSEALSVLRSPLRYMGR